MSDIHDPRQAYPQDYSSQPPAVIPVHFPPPPRPRSSGMGGCLKALLVMGVLGAVVVSVVVVFAYLAGSELGGGGGDGDGAIYERYHSGKNTAQDKIAVIRIDGVLYEGLTGYAQRQIKRAAGDDRVKAIVLRIDSPGGTITASDDLHKRIKELSDGLASNQKGGKKPVVVSMGALAASGGYYIAMPAQHLVAERTTITGSIGVFASFPNIKELGDKYGFRMNLVKAGEVKDSGSMFKDMTAQERQLWQDMVDHAFTQFLKIVEDGRPKLKGKLRDVVIRKKIPDVLPNGEPKKDDKGNQVMVEYERRRADGGIWTADDALKYGLIDQVGYMEDAVKEAHKLAGLGEDFKVIQYDPPHVGLLGLLLGSQSAPPISGFDPKRLAQGATPRLWYMAPQSELAGLLAATGRE